MVGVCAASNVQRFGTPRPAPQASSTRLLHDLHAVGHEVAAAADRRRPRPAPAGHVGTWLAEALGVPVPTHDLALASDCDTDPVLRTDSLLAIRCNWVALASALLLAIEDLDHLTGSPPAAERGALAASAATLAASAVQAARLAPRMRAFDHHAGWTHLRQTLIASVASVCAGLQSLDAELLRRTRQHLLARLARAIVATHALDTRLAGARPDAAEPAS
jgi:hypothetical protein